MTTINNHKVAGKSIRLIILARIIPCKTNNNFRLVDVSYAASQAHRIVNVALHQEYSPGIVFIFSQGRKDLSHV
jgi:predicted nicotinamide N-methyase